MVVMVLLMVLPSPTGDNWYDSGMSTTVSSNWVWGTSGSTRTALTNWNIDGGSNQNPTRANSGTLTTISVTMSAAHTINFISTTQYYLTVTGGNSVTFGTASPTGDQWYDSGTSTTVSSNWVWGTSGSTRTALTNWNIDGGSNQNPTRANSGTLTTISVTMSAAHTINFISTTQYYLTVTGGNSVTFGTASPTGDQWYDSGTSTTVSSNWVWNTVSGQSRTAITNYAIDGSNKNPTRSNTGTLTTSSVSMTTYHTVSFSSVTQYYLTVTGGNGITYGTASPTSDNWYDSGGSTTVTSNGVYSRSSGIGTRITAWNLDSGSNNNVATTGLVTTSAVSMSTYHTVTFNSVTQYQVTLDSGATSALNTITSSTISGDSGWYDSGTSVTLTLNGIYGRSGGSGTRISGYTINGGSNNPESTTGTFTVLTAISISAPQTITTTKVTQYQVTLDATSTSALNSITSPTINSDNYWYDTGTAVNVMLNGVWGQSGGTGTRLTGYVINGGTNNPTSTTGTVTVLSGAISTHEFVTATSTTQYQVTFAVSPSGTGTTTPSGINVWEDAGTLSISATGNTGYSVDHWSSSTGSITFTNAYAASTFATIGGTGTITANFAQKVTELVTITPANGYSSSASVTVSGAGASVTSIPMDGLQHSFTATPSSTITFTVPADGSNSRYRFNNAGTASTTWSYTTAASGTDTKSNTVYYQLQNNFNYAVLGTGSPTSPTLTGYQLGSTAILTLSTSNQVFWSDYNTAATATNPTADSTGTHRFNDNDQSFTITTGGGTNTFTYYNQYSYQLDYAVSGTGSPTAPTLTSTRFGASYTPTLTTSLVTYWLDAGQAWSVTNPLGGSGSNEKWYSSQTVSGTVSSSSPTTAGNSLTFTYSHQYYVTIVSANGTPTPSQWVNAGGTLSIAITNYSYHSFNHWSSNTGSITFQSSTSISTTATINGYGTITANWNY